MSKEELIEVIRKYEDKHEKKKEYNRNYYKTEKGRENIKRSQKKYYNKKKLKTETANDL